LETWFFLRLGIMRRKRLAVPGKGLESTLFARKPAVIKAAINAL